MELASVFWSAFGGVATGLTVVGGLGSLWLGYRLSRQLEAAKSEFARFSFEHQVKFSHLHIQRAEAIANAYELLTDLLDAAARYSSVLELSGMGSREERAQSLNKARVKLSEHLKSKMIYFPKDLAEKIEALQSEANSAIFDFVFKVDSVPPKDVDRDAWGKAYTKVSKDLRLVLDALGDEFREILEPPVAKIKK